ncbi:MAG: hypothetical protein A2V66_14825 [Ignavibacteria bacterium RBG_13_36_8]|nr:MAG: hypothetical protein A2V66_14825 [Ignavibacteria bacterium RBG_13_36_8]
MNVLIVGAGNIAAKFDTANSPQILTYAHAITNSPLFNLVGFVDKNLKAAESATIMWGGKSYNSIEEAFRNETVDVVINAVPDDFHFEVLKKLTSFPLKFIIAEKPLTKTLSEAEKIIEIFQQKKISVAVNYARRYVPEFDEIKKNIQNGIYGKFLTGSGYYGKGIVHNGSHLIDLLRFLIGEILDVKIISSENDFYCDDPSISGILNLGENRFFYLQIVNCNNYSLFEIDLLFEKKRLRILNSGFDLEFYDVKNDDIYKDYKLLSKDLIKTTSLSKQLTYLLENVYNHITKRENIKCTIFDAYQALKICELLKTSLKG